MFHLYLRSLKRRRRNFIGFYCSFDIRTTNRIYELDAVCRSVKEGLLQMVGSCQKTGHCEIAKFQRCKSDFNEKRVLKRFCEWGKFRYECVECGQAYL